jgi:hypothetical protein
MDDSLYDEFGNFIGTIESDAESQASQDDLDARADAYLHDEDDDDEDGENPAEEQLMQVDGIESYIVIHADCRNSYERDYFARR